MRLDLGEDCDFIARLVSAISAAASSESVLKALLDPKNPKLIWISSEEVCQRLSISRRTLSRLTEEKKITVSYTFGANHPRYPLCELPGLMEAKRVPKKQNAEPEAKVNPSNLQVYDAAA